MKSSSMDLPAGPEPEGYASWQGSLARRLPVGGVVGLSLLAWAIDRSGASLSLSIVGLLFGMVLYSALALLAWVYVPRSWRMGGVVFDDAVLEIQKPAQLVQRIEREEISALQRRSRWFIFELATARPIIVPTYMLSWECLVDWLGPSLEDIEIVDLRPGRAAKVTIAWATAVLFSSAFAYSVWTLITGEGGCLLPSTLVVGLVIWIFFEVGWHSRH